MRILFVEPAAEFSIADVGRGFRNALERQGHEIRDYSMVKRYEYHQRALPDEVKNNVEVLARQASENILNEALYHDAELVLVVSGLNVHPIILWSLSKINIPVAVIFTESPYDDDSQSNWLDLSKVGAESNVVVFTNDKYSAEYRGWHYLAPAFDPAIHRPVEPIEEEKCDVLMIGTGWRERQAFLEAVNWTGIKLRLYGIWPDLDKTPDSPLHEFYRPVVVNNSRIAQFYCSAKICLNFHRRSSMAYTPNPRAYEIAACGAFQLSDPRPGLKELFGDKIFTFETPEQLQEAIRFYLIESAARIKMAHEARDLVQNETFDHRAKELMKVLSERLARADLAPATVA